MRPPLYLIIAIAVLIVSPSLFAQTVPWDSALEKLMPHDPDKTSKCHGFNLEPDIFRVPDDYPTIQAGIQAARHGDIVLVSPGTYFENINFLGKLIKVISTDGPLNTTIDGGYPENPDKASVVTFENGEGPRAIIAGFEITNGRGTKALPLGYHCGGGVFCDHASPTIVNNFIVRNKAFSPFDKSNIEMGGIENGTSASAGKGQMLPGQSGLPGSGSVEKSNIGVGGGIGCYESAAQIINNILCFNSSETKGGAIACGRANVRVINCTVTNNWSGTGGSIYASSESRFTIINSIFWKNDATTGEEWAIRNYSVFIISYTDLEGGMDAIRLGPNSTLNWGPGMIDALPLFVTGPEGDFYLGHDAGAFSPCVNAGSADAFSLGFGTSWTHKDEVPDSGLVDMGFHYGPHLPQPPGP